MERTGDPQTWPSIDSLWRVGDRRRPRVKRSVSKSRSRKREVRLVQSGKLERKKIVTTKKWLAIRIERNSIRNLNLSFRSFLSIDYESF